MLHHNIYYLTRQQAIWYLWICHVLESIWNRYSNRIFFFSKTTFWSLAFRVRSWSIEMDVSKMGIDQLKWAILSSKRWRECIQGVFFPFAFLHVNDMQIVPIYRLDAFHNEQENPDQLPHDCTGVLTRQTTQWNSFSPLPLLPPPPIFICIYASLKKLKFRLYSFGMQFDLEWLQMHSESFIHVLN